MIGHVIILNSFSLIHFSPLSETIFLNLYSTLRPTDSNHLYLISMANNSFMITLAGDFEGRWEEGKNTNYSEAFISLIDQN